jgi:DNA mismatch endonuclease (patch repair protein)
MSDTLTPKQRSERMGLIRAKNSAPEMTVRRLVHRLGYRYKLHVNSLPGKPDMVFPCRSKIIFVHGCFWHRHSATSCQLARMPKSRVSFWKSKLEKNRLRDNRNIRALKVQGWNVLTIWECQLSNIASLSKRIRSFLST